MMTEEELLAIAFGEEYAGAAASSSSASSSSSSASSAAATAAGGAAAASGDSAATAVDVEAMDRERQRRRMLEAAETRRQGIGAYAVEGGGGAGGAGAGGAAAGGAAAGGAAAASAGNLLRRTPSAEDEALARALMEEDERAAREERGKRMREQEEADALLAARLGDEEEAASHSVRVTLMAHSETACCVCYCDFEPDKGIIGFPLCNCTPSRHVMCPSCAINAVRTQVSADYMSMDCSMAPRPAPTGHGHGGGGGGGAAVGAPPAPARLVHQESSGQGKMVNEVVEELFQLCAKLTAGQKIPGDDDGLVRPLVAEELQRWQSVVAQRAAKKMGARLLTCPNPQCCCPIWDDEGEATGSSVSSLVAAASGGAGAGEDIYPATRCPSCKKAFCRLCQQSWVAAHAGRTCKEYSDMMAAQQDVGDLRAALGQTFKQCPTCRMAISHPLGHACHHICPPRGGAKGGCSNCGTHFCFVCLAVLKEEDRYGHFRTAGGCPLSCPEDGKCGCLPCMDCRKGKPCPACDGGCPVCTGRKKPTVIEAQKPPTSSSTAKAGGAAAASGGAGTRSSRSTSRGRAGSTGRAASTGRTAGGAAGAAGAAASARPGIRSPAGGGGAAAAGVAAVRTGRAGAPIAVVNLGGGLGGGGGAAGAPAPAPAPFRH